MRKNMVSERGGGADKKKINKKIKKRGEKKKKKKKKGSLQRWTKMSTQQQGQHWNAGVKEIQQLNPGGPDQRQTIKTQTTSLKVLGRSHH